MQVVTLWTCWYCFFKAFNCDKEFSAANCMFSQPMHAYDLDKDFSDRIVVRRANEGEKLTTLDGKDHDLSVEDPADHRLAERRAWFRVLGIAGVMGGLYGEVTAETKNIPLELLISTRCRSRSARRHKIPLSVPVVSSVAWMISCSRLPPRWPPSLQMICS